MRNRKADQELSQTPKTHTEMETALTFKVKELVDWVDAAARAGLADPTDFAKMVEAMDGESLLGQLAIARGWAESILSKADRAASPTNWVQETHKEWVTWHYGKGQELKAARLAA